jgi:hypothetical protein
MTEDFLLNSLDGNVLKKGEKESSLKDLSAFGGSRLSEPMYRAIDCMELGLTPSLKSLPHEGLTVVNRLEVLAPSYRFEKTHRSCHHVVSEGRPQCHVQG